MKRIISLFVSLLLIITFICLQLSYSCEAKDGDEVRASKKIISVVYDDSGSMIGDRWAYTNYAMQALIALLNEQDELYITFMSSPKKTIKFSTNDLESSINRIRKWKKSGGTPAEAVDTAKRKLDSISESDKSTQFWLMILTDGAMYSTSGADFNLQKKLDSMKSNKMSNESPLKVVYLGMDGSLQVKDDQDNGLYQYNTDNDSKIIKEMKNIANLVSSRIVASNVNKVNDTTIEVDSTLPLYSISIISQKSSAIVKSAKTEEEQLNVERNLKLDARKLYYSDKKIKSLYGRAIVINKKGDNGELVPIPAGKYTIEFSEKIDMNSIIVQLEPAIGLKSKVSKNGIEIKDLSKLQLDEEVDIEIVPVVPGTDKEISDSDLPNNIKWGIEYEVNGKVQDSGKGRKLLGVKLKKGNNILRGTMEIPGYSPSIVEIPFDIRKIVYHLGIKAEQPKNLKYKRGFKEIKNEKGKVVRFFITNDGKPLSKKEQEKLGVSLILDDIHYAKSSSNSFREWFGFSMADSYLKQNADGSYSLIPTKSWWVPKLFIKTGDYTAIVKLSSDINKTSQGTFKVTTDSWEFVFFVVLLIILLLLIYLILLLTKKKFKTQNLYYDIWKLKSDGKGQLIRSSVDIKSITPLKGIHPSPFKLHKRESYFEYQGLTLYATKRGSIKIDGDSISRKVYKYGESSKDPEKYLRNIVRRMNKAKTDDNQNLAENIIIESDSKVYFMDSEGQTRIWRLYIK